MANPFASTFASLGDQLERGEPSVVERVAGIVEGELAQPDRTRLAQLRAVVDKLARRAEEPACSDLRELEGDVQAVQRRLRYAEVDGARARELETVRERVADLLAERGPLRPLDLARALQVDPSQVSRALRELLREGRVRQRLRPPPGDGRGRWYEVGGRGRFREEVLAALEEPGWTEARLEGAGGRTRVITARPPDPFPAPRRPPESPAAG